MNTFTGLSYENTNTLGRFFFFSKTEMSSHGGRLPTVKKNAPLYAHTHITQLSL